jgi:Fe-S-cluster-containing dehydrogenase component
MSTEYALVIDYKYCTGCHVCEVSCRNEHKIPLEEWGIKLVEYGPAKMQGQWLWDYIPAPSQLCDLCADRRAAGKAAACEHHCLSKCMKVVALEELSGYMAELGPGAACFVPKVV